MEVVEGVVRFAPRIVVLHPQRFSQAGSPSVRSDRS